MKTKNNVQKTLLRWAAVFVSFVLISFTVSAQDFWKNLIENSSFGNIAMAMVDTKEMPAALPAANFIIEEEMDANLELENWMTDETTFAISAFNYSLEMESELLPEAWMFDEEIFSPEASAESALQVEDWMVNESVWKI